MDKVLRGRKKKLEYFNDFILTLLSHHEAEERCLFRNTSISTKNQKLKRKMVAAHEAIRKQVQAVLDTYLDDDMWSARLEVLKEIINLNHREEREIIYIELKENTEDINYGLILTSYVKEKEKELLRLESDPNLKKGLILKAKEVIQPGSIAALQFGEET